VHSTCIFGGVSEGPQKKAMARGVDILVATPGRLLDLLGQRALHFSSLGVFVLDEADRMLDMGFINDINKIVALLPQTRQNLFFSATMPADIAVLASRILRNPVRVEVTPSATPIEIIDQVVYAAEKREKEKLLLAILRNKAISRALVFCRTKHCANKVCESLLDAGIVAAAIHGNKSQNRRQEALAGFQDGAIRILVATDIAARGIDVEKISHVVNYDLPEVAETYIHRIGRTARAGASGTAISFCSMDERVYLSAIDRLIHKKVPRGDAAGILKTTVIAPDSILSKTGRYDKDLRVYLPGAGEARTTPGAPRHGGHQGNRFQSQQRPHHRETKIKHGRPAHHQGHSRHFGEHSR
jgi:ATP-dependent RNA helicase RhlE